METLYRSDNTKVKFKKNHFNTFGLNYGLPKNGGTCPGATLGTGGCLNIREGHKRPTCYMAKVTAIYKDVGKRLQQNTDLLKGKSLDQMVEVLTSTVEEFKTKNKGENLFFRLHYSGDFYSDSYAKAWAITIKKFPEIRFWVYSRSHSGKLDYIHNFVGISNISVYLSVDPSNYQEALKSYKKYEKEPNFALAWMGGNPPDKSILRWVNCPETSGRLKNTETNGACSRCRLCVDNYVTKLKNINFSIH